jgi:hypothetical protein
MNQGYPLTVYATPEQWGSYTVYANDEGMEEQIKSLKAAGGAEWDDIDLSDCTEYELVAACNDGSAAYRPRHVRYNHDVLIFRRNSDDATYFELAETYHDDDDELAALGVSI